MPEKKEEDFMWLIDAIEIYKMDELESRACHIASLWLEKSRKAFPNYRHSRMKKGDPRKSLIFKICYKLARETNGVLEERDYPLYVRSQIDVLKYVNNGKEHPLVDANCLVGERAWKRWKMWKKRYDAIKKKPQESVATGIGFQKAIDGIEKTKEFLTKSFNSDLSYSKFHESYINNNIFRWIALGKISPYYLARSPFIKKIFTEEDYKKINFDINVYTVCINESVESVFRKCFPLESTFEQESDNAS
jgi:hypothetical protein